MNEEEIRSQINDIIEGEIQNSINEYLESHGESIEETSEEKKGCSKGEGKLKVSVSQAEVNKLIKEYKKTRKYMKSNLFEASQLGLVDKNGRQL